MNLDLIISILTMHISGYVFRVIDLSDGYDELLSFLCFNH